MLFPSDCSSICCRCYIHGEARAWWCQPGTARGRQRLLGACRGPTGLRPSSTSVSLSLLVSPCWSSLCFLFGDPLAPRVSPTIHILRVYVRFKPLLEVLLFSAPGLVSQRKRWWSWKVVKKGSTWGIRAAENPPEQAPGFSDLACEVGFRLVWLWVSPGSSRNPFAMQDCRRTSFLVST